MERPEIKLGGPQRELKLREPWHGMGRKGPLRTWRASRDQKGPSIDMGGARADLHPFKRPGTQRWLGGPRRHPE